MDTTHASSMNSLGMSEDIANYTAPRLMPNLDANAYEALRQFYASAIGPETLAKLQNDMFKQVLPQPPAATPSCQSVEPQHSFEGLEHTSKESKAVSPGLADLKTSLSQFHQTFFMDGIRDLHKQGFGVDITFILADGRIGANCSVLACASPLLKELLLDNREHPHISIPDIRLKTMKHLMAFLYTGHLQVEASLSDMLQVSHLLGLDELLAILLKSNPPVDQAECQDLMVLDQPLSSHTSAKLAKRRKFNSPDRMVSKKLKSSSAHHEPTYTSNGQCILGELLTKTDTHKSSHTINNIVYSSHDRSNTPLNLTKCKTAPVVSASASTSSPHASSYLTNRSLGSGSISASTSELALAAFNPLAVNYPSILSHTNFNPLFNAFNSSYSSLAANIAPTKSKTSHSSKKLKKDSTKTNHKKGTNQTCGTILQGQLNLPTATTTNQTTSSEMIKDIYERIGANKSLTDWPTIALPPLLNMGTNVGLNFLPSILAAANPNHTSHPAHDDDVKVVVEVPTISSHEPHQTALNLSSVKIHDQHNSDYDDLKVIAERKPQSVPCLKIGHTDLVAGPSECKNALFSASVHRPRSVDVQIKSEASCPTKVSSPMTVHSANQTDSGTQTSELSTPRLISSSVLMPNAPFSLGTLGINFTVPSTVHSKTFGSQEVPKMADMISGPVDLSLISSRSKITVWQPHSSGECPASDVDVVGSPLSDDREDTPDASPAHFSPTQLHKGYILSDPHRPASLIHPELLFHQQRDSTPATPDSIEVIEENICTDKAPFFQQVAQNGGNMGRRRKGCGDCAGCQEVQDCAHCRFCKDKGKFGGPNRLKQVCVNKKCLAVDTDTEDGKKKKKKMRKKISRCGNCKPCQTNHDCGDCEACLSNSSPQAPNRKKICELRVCVEQEMDAFLEKGNLAEEPSPYSTDSLRGSALIYAGLPVNLMQHFQGHKAKLMSKKSKKMDPNSKNSQSKARTKYYCGQCSGCMRTSPCGNCQYCEDMPKFGGPGRFRQKCMKQLCDHHPRLQTLKASNRSKLTGELMSDPNAYRSFGAKESLLDMNHLLQPGGSGQPSALLGLPNLISLVKPERLMESLSEMERLHPSEHGLDEHSDDVLNSDSDIEPDSQVSDHYRPVSFPDVVAQDEDSSSLMEPTEQTHVPIASPTDTPPTPIGKLHIKKCEEQDASAQWQIKSSPTYPQADNVSDICLAPSEGNNNESPCKTPPCGIPITKPEDLASEQPCRNTAPPQKSLQTSTQNTQPERIYPEAQSIDMASQDLQVPPPEIVSEPLVCFTSEANLASPQSSDLEIEEAVARSIEQIESDIASNTSSPPLPLRGRGRGRGRGKKRGRGRGRGLSLSPAGESAKKNKRGRKRKCSRFTVDPDDLSDYEEYYFPLPTERDLEKQAAELNKYRCIETEPIDASLDAAALAVTKDTPLMTANGLEYQECGADTIHNSALDLKIDPDKSSLINYHDSLVNDNLVKGLSSISEPSLIDTSDGLERPISSAGDPARQLTTLVSNPQSDINMQT